MIENPTKEQMEKSLCNQCHWKGGKGYYCHATNPPRQVTVAIDNTSDCAYIPQSYWDRIPQDQKDRLNEDVERRSQISR